MGEDWECWEHGGTCHNDKPGHWGERINPLKTIDKLLDAVDYQLGVSFLCSQREDLSTHHGFLNQQL